MFTRRPVAYALLALVLLVVSALGANSVNAQNPPAPPAQSSIQETQGFQPDQMMDAMGGMLDQMDALLAATEHAAHQQMAPAMIKILDGMQELGQPVTEQIYSQSGSGHEVQLERMTESDARMKAMTERLHGMAGHSAAPATPAPESAQPLPAAPAEAQIQMGQQMQMMGMMMQMMGMMSGAGMMEDGQPMGGEMMEMMGPMMQKMGQMQRMMGDGMMGKGMMGGEGMGSMGAGAPMTGTAVTQSLTAGPTAANETATQNVEGGGVIIKVTPLSLTDADAATLDFAVSLDTHTVELNYDLTQLATLTDNLGNSYAPASWSPDKSDGHHVGGLLSFADRATILQEDVTEVTLIVNDVAGVAERTFVWSVTE